MGSIFNQHKDRIRYLKHHLSSLVEIWECQWDSLVKTDEEYRLIVENEDDIRLDLSPRDALF
jgi:hypothetical protein